MGNGTGQRHPLRLAPGQPIDTLIPQRALLFRPGMSGAIESELRKQLVHPGVCGLSGPPIEAEWGGDVFADGQCREQFTTLKSKAQMPPAERFDLATSTAGPQDAQIVSLPAPIRIVSVQNKGLDVRGTSW